MKTFLKIIGGIVAFIVVAFTLIMFLTSDLTQSADEFFMATKNGNYEKAYSMLSDDFKAKVTKSEFKKFIETNGLNRYKEAKWSSRSIEAQKGELDGSIITEDGGAIPIKLKFVKANDSWKIYAIEKPKAGVIIDNQKQESKKSEIYMPSFNEIQNLINSATRKMGESLESGDFSIIYNSCSKFLTKNHSLEEFKTIFSKYTPYAQDFLKASNLSPILTNSAKLNEKGVLSVEGYYQLENKKLYFEYEFFKENNQWKIVTLMYKFAQ